MIIGKHFQNNVRTRYLCVYQDAPDEVSVWTDAGCVGCRRTRNPIRAGVVMWGERMVKSWSSAQRVMFYHLEKPGVMA